jgi:hypothetical protein
LIIVIVTNISEEQISFFQQNIFTKRKNNHMYERKQAPSNVKTPDLSKMKAVVIDFKTVIYIEHGASEEEARKRYSTRGEYLNKSLVKRKEATAK